MLKMLMSCLEVGMDSNSQNWKEFAWCIFCWTFKLTLFLNCEDNFQKLHMYFKLFDNLICRTLTLSDTYLCLRNIFFSCRETMTMLPMKIMKTYFQKGQLCYYLIVSYLLVSQLLFVLNDAVLYLITSWINFYCL